MAYGFTFSVCGQSGKFYNELVFWIVRTIVDLPANFIGKYG